MGAFSMLDLEQQFSAIGGQPIAAVENAEEEKKSPYEAESLLGKAQEPTTDEDVAQECDDDVPEGVKAEAPEDAELTDETEEDSSGEQKTEAESDDEDAKRQAHEEAEAKRKAEFEAKFAERRAKEQAERDRVAALSDDAVMMEAMKRVAAGFERLTRRNMKDMVSEYVQTMCVSDPAFGRCVMDPKKSMINCVRHINNKAREYIKQEMEDNDIQPENGMYGGDVPDDVVYQWAVEYFNDPNAKEDEVKEEKFVPKPYYGGSSKSKKKEKAKPAKKAEKKPAKEKPQKKTAPKPAESEQISLLDGFGTAGENAA